MDDLREEVEDAREVIRLVKGQRDRAEAALARATPSLSGFVMLLAGTDNIRDVIAFPKTASASDLMMNAPSRVSGEQLKELHIEFTPKSH